MTHRINYRKSHEADAYSDLRLMLMDDALCAAVEEAREVEAKAWVHRMFESMTVLHLNFDAMADVWREIRLPDDFAGSGCIRLRSPDEKADTFSFQSKAPLVTATALNCCK